MLNLEKVVLLTRSIKKSILKGTKLNERFRSNENIEKADVDEKKFNFLYMDEKIVFLWIIKHLSKFLCQNLMN